MMDFISSFIHKNLEDFVNSYTTSILPQNETNSTNPSEIKNEDKEQNTIEHKEHSQTESPNLLSPKHRLCPDSFIDKSIVESVFSSTNKALNISVDNQTDERNNKMYGEYGKERFDLSVDILPIATTQNKSDTHSITDGQWTQLPNVVNANDFSETNHKNKSISANDSFLSSIAKEIQLLDEELSSMGLLTGNHSTLITKANSLNNYTQKIEQSIDSSKIVHDNEEKMDILIPQNNSYISIEITDKKQIELSEIENVSGSDTGNGSEEEVSIIKDKLSLLRKSLIIKKKTVTSVPTQNEGDKKVSEQTIDLSFATQLQIDAYFDPLFSPPKTKTNAIENINYTHAIHHENATKIQKQWKKFQLKTLLMNTFNRHLKQSKQNNLPITVTDLMASATHEIVDHAEKLFSAVHDHNGNEYSTMIGQYSYAQLHFCGSPALDWSAVYSMIESIVLRNFLYYKNAEIVRKILDTQQILDDILSTNNINDSIQSNCNADAILIDQLTTQLIQLKTELYEGCSRHINCNICPLRLFPKNVNIFQSNHSNSTNHSVSKPEFNEIKSQLSLLRKSFSQRRRNGKKFRSAIRSSPKLSESLRSSIIEVNDQIDSLCNENIYETQQRPMTAPNHSNLAPKKAYLKRKKLSNTLPKKVDWSYVKPKTVSRLSNNVRSARIANNSREHYKPNVINWKQRALSRVDCTWSSDKYRSTTKLRKHKRKRKRIPQKPVSEFEESYHNSKNKKNHISDDKYLYYLKKGNKIGKITRDSATAQLHDGTGSMILQTKSINGENKISVDYDQDSNECGSEMQSENPLHELEETFAAIEKAMKQRRQQMNV